MELGCRVLGCTREFGEFAVFAVSPLTLPLLYLACMLPGVRWVLVCHCHCHYRWNRLVTAGSVGDESARLLLYCAVLYIQTKEWK